MIDGNAASVASPVGPALLVLAVCAFVWSGINRIKWDRAWRASDFPTVMIPERCWFYGAHQLDAFAGAAPHVSIGARSSLAFYKTSILMGSDIAYAISLAFVTAWAWYSIVVSPPPWAWIAGIWLWLQWMAFPMGAMAILYGVADVAEDLKLAAILDRPDRIDRADAAAANMLTRVKMFALTLSVIGVLFFLIILLAQKLAERIVGRTPRPRTGVPV